jgi:hypothetical protein
LFVILPEQPNSPNPKLISTLFLDNDRMLFSFSFLFGITSVFLFELLINFVLKFSSSVNEVELIVNCVWACVWILDLEIDLLNLFDLFLIIPIANGF